ncbi:MAG: hypothetical protein VKK04_15250 [Synechococcales bacterium]|nr:hypothetical protein [Synechococcales bacterium]
MSSDPRDLIPMPTTEAPSTAESSIQRRPKFDIHRPEPSPLPGNRPVADNNTEEIDEMLGYLD